MDDLIYDDDDPSASMKEGSVGDDNDDVIMVHKPISVRHQEFFDRMNNFADLKMRYFTEIVQRFGVKDGAVSIMRGMDTVVPVR